MILINATNNDIIDLEKRHNMKIKLFKYQDLKAAKWSGGNTKQIYIFPENSSYKNKDFLFRISSASISAVPATFTLFLGYTRYLCMLDNDLQLKINDREHELKKHKLISFHSEDDVVSTSTGHDFNLMIKDDIQEHEVVLANGFITKDNHFIIIFALEKMSLELNNELFNLDRYDTLIIENFNSDEVDLITKDHCLLATLTLAYTI